MRESRTYGFVRGAHRNMRPYRDPYLPSALGHVVRETRDDRARKATHAGKIA